MKKLFLLMALCLFLTGCNSTKAETDENEHETQEGLGFEEASTNQVDEKLSKFYEEDILITETINDIQFGLPESWTQSTRTEGNWHYYYFDELMVGINSKAEYQLTNESAVENIDKIVEGMLEENGELISKGVLTFWSKKEVRQIFYQKKLIA